MKKKPETLVLTLYPISSAYQALLEATIGSKPTYRLISELRHGGLANLFRSLLASRFRRVILPCEVAEAESALSVVQLLAAAHKLPRIEVADPEGNLRQVGLGTIFSGAIGFAFASFDGLRARARVGQGARRAIAAPRSRVSPHSGAHRILFLKNNLWFGVRAGGSVGHVSGVVNGLTQLGHAVHFLSPESPKYLSPLATSDSVPTFRHFAFPPEANLFRMHEQSLREALRVAREFRPTMVYQRLSLGDWSGVEVANALGVPLVVEYNGSELWGALNWGTGSVPFAREMLAAEEAMLRRAQLVFSISRPLNDELLGRGIDPRHLAWYPNCVDPVIFDPERIPQAARASAREQMGASAGDFVVVFVGTFGRWHGAEIFAKAAALLCADSAWTERVRIRFAFVGDGKTRNMCGEIIRASQAAVRTVFTGLVPQHEAPRFLAASDAFVASHVPNADGSKFFGSPTKLFEYMAMGRPIIASALDQMAEVLKNDLTALLVEPGNAVSLAAGIRRITDDRELGNRLGVAARAEALRKYTWPIHVQVMLDALEASTAEKGT